MTLRALSVVISTALAIAQVIKYERQLKSDDLISHHLQLLYDKMLEANLLKIIHPYR